MKFRKVQNTERSNQMTNGICANQNILTQSEQKGGNSLRFILILFVMYGFMFSQSQMSSLSKYIFAYFLAVQIIQLSQFNFINNERRELRQPPPESTTTTSFIRMTINSIAKVYGCLKKALIIAFLIDCFNLVLFINQTNQNPQQNSQNRLITTEQNESIRTNTDTALNQVDKQEK